VSVPDDEELVASLEEQERRLQLDAFGPDDAWELGTLLVELARERDLAVTVDVRRPGHVLFHVALNGTTPENDAWVECKVRVVERFHASSYLVGRRLAAKGRTLGVEQGVDPLLFAAHGGAFPIRVRGVGVVGTVTVSGLAQADDHALVVEGLERLIAAGATS
jgi:uncharacterized protein (UPF0303 family)